MGWEIGPVDDDVRMALEWVASVGTAVVGVAGIAGTWLSAAGQRASQTALAAQSHQEQRWHRLREERLRLYGELLGGLAAVEAEVIGLWSRTAWVGTTASQLHLQGLEEDEAMRVAMAGIQSRLDESESMEAFRGLYRVRGQVSLIAGSGVREAATLAVAAAVRALGGSLADATSDKRGELRERIEALENAAAEELNVRLGPAV